MKTITKNVTRTIVETIIENYISYEDFENWLIQKGIHEQYMFNIVRRKKNISCFFSRVDIDNAIDGAFTWIDTSEGHEYWSSRNNEWIKYLRDNNVEGWEREMPDK